MEKLTERGRTATGVSQLETLTGDLAKRGQRYAARAARFKDLRGSAFIAWAGATDARKLERPAYSMSYRRTPPGLQVTDPDLIPRRFLGEPRKTDLLRALKGGEEVPGAVLSNGGETVATRTK